MPVHNKGLSAVGERPADGDRVVKRSRPVRASDLAAERLRPAFHSVGYDPGFERDTTSGALGV